MKYKVRDLANTMALLDREVKYLINKAKIWRPKQESVMNQTESAIENATETKERSESESIRKSTTDSETEKFSEESTSSDNANVQNEKPAESNTLEDSTVMLKNNKVRSNHKSTQEDGAHQEL